MVELEEPLICYNASSQPRNSLLVAVGIPAFNEEKTIARVILEAQKHSHLIIVCDDGSSDLTCEIAVRLGAVVIRHKKNMGYGAALQSLFRRAKDLDVDMLVTLDSDGQHDPTQIPLLIKPIQEGVAEVVLGSRFKDENGASEMPFYRKIGIKTITKLANGSAKNCVSDAQSGFRAYSKQALERLSMFETGMSASIELLRIINESGLKVCEVPISCKYSSSVGVKTSTNNPLTHGAGLVMSLVKLVVEDRPLRFLGLPGIAALVVGAFFSVWLLNVYATTHKIITNLALASIGFILIGFFLVSTAITLYAIKRIAKQYSNHRHSD